MLEMLTNTISECQHHQDESVGAEECRGVWKLNHGDNFSSRCLLIYWPLDTESWDLNNNSSWLNITFLIMGQTTNNSEDAWTWSIPDSWQESLCWQVPKVHSVRFSWHEPVKISKILFATMIFTLWEVELRIFMV